MAEDKKPVKQAKAPDTAAKTDVAKPKPKLKANTTKRRRFVRKDNRQESEFDQTIIDLARVTRVMAGGKRMRFRACVVIGNRKGQIGLGLAKGADVTIAINKATNQARKAMINVPLADGTIPHEIKHKFGSSVILLKPAKAGKGIICGGVVRQIAELAGIHNITGKLLGTNNKVTNAKCMVEALDSLKPARPNKAKAAKEEQKPAAAKAKKPSAAKKPAAKKDTAKAEK